MPASIRKTCITRLRQTTNMRFRYLSLVCILALSVFLGETARAISVSPAIVDVSVDMGQRKEFSVLVTNEEAKTLTYALSIQKFIPQGDSGRAQFLPPQDTSGLPDWLFLDAPTITLRSGESKRVSVSLRVPDDASSGGHYAAIFFTQTNLDTTLGQAVSAIPRIGVLVFTTVNGTMIERLVLNQARVEQVSGSYLPVRFVVDIENQGNIHVQPAIRIDVTNVFGQAVATIDGNDTRGRILPGSKRLFTSNWTKETIQSDGSFWSELKREWRNGAIGWYQAKIQVSSRVGAAGEVMVSFQVWPWRSISVLIVSLLIVISVLLSARRARRRRFG